MISNGYDSIKLYDIKKNKNVKFHFTNKTPKVDGSFIVKVFPQEMKKTFGYYTNGIDPNTNFLIRVEVNVIDVKEVNQ